MQFVDSISTSTVIPVTSLLIRHLHQLMLGPHERVHTPGEFRRGEARVRHPVSREVVYIGPDAGDVPDHMRQFETWLSSAAQDLSAVIAAGIAHLRLVEIHPFADGNGRTARALTTLLLQRGGFSFNRLLSLERYFDFDVVKYCDAIGATVGDRYADGRNLTEWLEYFTFALSVQVQVASDEVLALRKQMERWHTVLMEKGYVERHRDLLGFALTNGGIRPRDVMRIANVSSVTAGSDLKRLAEAGLLRG